MITLNYGQIRDPIFMDAIQTLMQTKFPLATTRKIMLLEKAIQAEFTVALELFKPLEEKWMKPVGRGLVNLRTDLSPEDTETAMKQLDEFNAIPVEISLAQIPLSEIQGAPISAIQLIRMEGIFDAD